MSEFTFVDAPPPPKRGRNDVYARFREASRERPGEWAIYPREFSNAVSAATTAANIRSTKRMSLYDGFEAKASHCQVYVRYVGQQ